jgi:hypothetical protein
MFNRIDSSHLLTILCGCSDVFTMRYLLYFKSRALKSQKLSQVETERFVQEAQNLHSFLSDI